MSKNNGEQPSEEEKNLSPGLFKSVSRTALYRELYTLT